MESPARHLFTSESVTEGHPDKIADQISDAILDAILAKDPMSRVACETLVTTGLAIVAGEITTTAVIDYQEVVRATIAEVGYTAASTATTPRRARCCRRSTASRRTSRWAWTRAGRATRG